jgi:hypothetical protein
MRVYLDDTRPTPDGWVGVKTAPEAITLLQTGQVVEISLDHDLGVEPGVGDGYDPLKWIEEQVVLHGFEPPAIIRVHTSNPSAAMRMRAAIDNIMRLAGRTY